MVHSHGARYEPRRYSASTTVAPCTFVGLRLTTLACGAAAAMVRALSTTASLSFRNGGLHIRYAFTDTPCRRHTSAACGKTANEWPLFTESRSTRSLLDSTPMPTSSLRTSPAM